MKTVTLYAGCFHRKTYTIEKEGQHYLNLVSTPTLSISPQGVYSTAAGFTKQTYVLQKFFHDEKLIAEFYLHEDIDLGQFIKTIMLDYLR